MVLSTKGSNLLISRCTTLILFFFMLAFLSKLIVKNIALKVVMKIIYETIIMGV